MRIPWWRSGEELPAHAGETESVPGLGRAHTPQSDQARAPGPRSHES